MRLVERYASDTGVGPDDQLFFEPRTVHFEVYAPGTRTLHCASP